LKYKGLAHNEISEMQSGICIGILRNERRKMVNLGNHIVECIWEFIQAFLGAVYLALILLVCVAVVALLHRFVIARQEGYTESQK